MGEGQTMTAELVKRCARRRLPALRAGRLWGNAFRAALRRAVPAGVAKRPRFTPGLHLTTGDYNRPNCLERTGCVGDGLSGVPVMRRTPGCECIASAVQQRAGKSWGTRIRTSRAPLEKQADSCSASHDTSHRGVDVPSAARSDPSVELVTSAWGELDEVERSCVVSMVRALLLKRRARPEA